MAVYTWRHEEKTGADLSGVNKAINRTYTLTNSNSVQPGMTIISSKASLQPTIDYTLSSGVITFLVKVWDDDELTFDYRTQDDVTPTLVGYTSTLQVVRVTGIGIEVNNENVGTGDSSETSFDLDNGHIITDSYTLKYSSSATSNDFTTLTETTHYVIDKNGGTIELTSSGVTALASNILWATYIHSPKMSDTTITTFLAPAEEEVDYKTGNYWGAVKTSIEYFDGRESFKYPTTDAPYVGVANDYDEPDILQLENKGVQSLQGLYFLAQGSNLGQVERYDATLASYTDVTSEANSPAGTSFQPFADTTAANDYLYVGASNQFHSLNTTLFTLGVTTGTNTMEYYNGSSWSSVTVTESESDVLNFEAAGKLSWSTLASWTKTTINNGSSLYFIRIKANSTYTTEAKLNSLYVGQDFVIDKNIALQTVTWDDTGRVSLLNNRLPDGNRNVRVDYKHGYSTTPDEIGELAAYYAGLRVFGNITGGSYDDATGYTVGREQIQIGEVWVNVREVVSKFNNRIADILKDVGFKMDVVV